MASDGYGMFSSGVTTFSSPQLNQQRTVAGTARQLQHAARNNLGNSTQAWGQPISELEVNAQ
jgi:hypothetical protein